MVPDRTGNMMFIVRRFPQTVAVLSGSLAIMSVLTAAAHGQIQLSGRNRGFVPFSDEPIHYLSDRVNDPLAKLQERIDRGEAKLEFEPVHGYLKSVLNMLETPISSQTPVFSKTSFQYRKISPQTPPLVPERSQGFSGQ
jgi:hypothetical protein